MNGLTRLQYGDVWWRVRSDVAEMLFDSVGFRLSSWLQSGQATVVKQGPHRTVYRVRFGGRSVYVKHYRAADTRAILSQCTRLSKSGREWDRAEHAAASGIPTIVPLALGEQRRAGLVLESYFVSEGIDDAEPLDRFVEHTFPQLPIERQAGIRRCLTCKLAELVAQLHDAGVRHPDLHSGNVLVRLRESGCIELFLIDLAEAKPARQADWAGSRADLLALGLFFFTMARAIDRARFFRRYVELRPQLGIHWRSESKRLQGDLRHRALRFWRKLDYRCTSNNRRFFYRNLGSAHGFAVAELGEPAMLALLRDPDAPFRHLSAEALKDSPSSDVVRLPLPIGDMNTPVIYKRFNCPKRFDVLRSTVHHSPGLRAWHAGHGLLIRRIATPRPLAIVERLSGPFIRQSYLVTQAIPDAINLKDYLHAIVKKLTAETRRHRVRWLLSQLGQFLRQMHERNISHRDMKAANFLVSPADPAAESPRIHLIDLAGVQIWRNLPHTRRIQNLTRVVVSLQSYDLLTRTDFLRLLCAYQPGARRDAEQWKSLWRRIQVRAARKIARNITLNRSVT